MTCCDPVLLQSALRGNTVNSKREKKKAHAVKMVRSPELNLNKRFGLIIEAMTGSLLPTPEVWGSARGRTVLRAAKATTAPVQLAGRELLLPRHKIDLL